MKTRRNPSTTGGQHSFARTPSANIQRSAFNRSCGTKTTFDAGWLVPIFVDEVLPGDTMNLKATIMCRLATLLSPIMDNIYLDLFFFAVPNRLIWENWEKFNGAQDDPGDSTDFLVPEINSPAGGYAAESLSDYLGIPIGVENLKHSALWHRAYNLIWNEWFRDQNLQDSVVVDKDDGPDAPADYVLLKRGKRHDYFTSCLPWPQKGDAVSLPLGDTAEVVGDGTPVYMDFNSTTYGIKSENGYSVDLSANPGGIYSGYWGTATGLEADLANASAATINTLRQAFQMQKLLERDARGGTRYSEVVRSHFGVISPDARLQRPEFLGGGTIPVVTSQVASTNDSAAVDLGELGAWGAAIGQGQGFSKSFTEHCVILGMVAARADLNYQEGLNRMLSRRTRYEFYWPALAHIGEQAVLNKEIYAQGTGGGTDDDDVFGYQERYAEYRYKPSMITGEMRSTHSTPLDNWHLAQEFGSLPVLGDTFIQENPPMTRVIAVADTQFLLDSFFSYRHVRPMPTYSVPGLIDHF